MTGGEGMRSVRRENKGRFYNRRYFVSKWLAGLLQVIKNSFHSPKLQRPKMSSLIVLKSQSQESLGGGRRTSEWGKGERKTSRRRKNKRRNPRKGKGSRGPGRPRSGRWGEHDPGSSEASRAGPYSAARRTMDRAPRGRGPHPSRGRREKSERPRVGPVPLRWPQHSLALRPECTRPWPGRGAYSTICAHLSLPTPAGRHFRAWPALGATILLPDLSSGWGYAWGSGVSFPATQRGWTHLSPAASIGPPPHMGTDLGPPPRPRPARGSHPRLRGVANGTCWRSGLG